MGNIDERKPTETVETAEEKSREKGELDESKLDQVSGGLGGGDFNEFCFLHPDDPACQ